MPRDKPDEESNLPKATSDKLIHDLLPKGFSVSKSLKMKLRMVCQAFLALIALKSNNICEEEKKKTINAQHVYKALEICGFGDYGKVCASAEADYEDYSRHKPSKQNKFKESGKSLEELHAEQLRLFSEAKQHIDKVYGISKDADSNVDEHEN